MRINEYFTRGGKFQQSCEYLINGDLPKGHDKFIPCPVIQRFNEDSISTIINNETGQVSTHIESRASDAEQAGILWSIIGTRDYAMDIDAYGLTDTWLVNLECVGNTILRAFAIADEVLSVLVKDGAIMQLLTRYDEPIDSDQAGRNYRSHNLTVSMNGVI